MAPCVVLLRLRWRDAPVYYMVRGDEATYAMKSGRPIRAYGAVLCQKILKLLGCYFVFVCDDLRVVFEKRLGPIERAAMLPNSIGRRLPATKPCNGRIAIVGDFGTVKNTEWAIENLSSGKYKVHLYGARKLPEKWRRSWLVNHGVVADLTEELKKQPALLLLPYVDAGFPNVIVEALQAGCPVVVHDRFPFQYLPYHDAWRFRLSDNPGSDPGDAPSDLELFLDRVHDRKGDFASDNEQLVKIIESSWEDRVWDILT